jgi:lipopolysaccharide export system permease protein
MSPPADDAVYAQMPGQFNAELHDRFLGPIYPFAFACLTFAFLGSPRTTRQSRNFSMGCAIGAVFAIRLAGFALSVMAAKTASAALVQYLMLAAAIGASIWIIVSGVVIEPPAGLMEAINRSNARLLRWSRLGRRPVAT